MMEPLFLHRHAALAGLCQPLRFVVVVVVVFKAARNVRNGLLGLRRQILKLEAPLHIVIQHLQVGRVHHPILLLFCNTPQHRCDVLLIPTVFSY